MSDENDSMSFSPKQMVGVIVGLIILFGGQSYITKDNSNDQTIINVESIKSQNLRIIEVKKEVDLIKAQITALSTSVHSIDVKVSVMKESTESLKKQNNLIIIRQNESISYQKETNILLRKLDK